MTSRLIVFVCAFVAAVLMLQYAATQGHKADMRRCQSLYALAHTASDTLKVTLNQPSCLKVLE